MIYEYTNYREFLRSQLVEKIEKNSSYSLRAMAGNLDISPSSLSEVLSGKRNLSHKNASKIANKLGLDSKEAEYFCLLVQVEQVEDPILKESIQNRIHALNPERKSHNLNLDIFRMIADWYHTAILHLSEIQNFDLTVVEVADRLDISEHEAQLAIDRLIRLGLLKDENGTFIKVSDYFTESGVANEGLRKFHKQTLEKAIESLHTQTPQEKIIRSETLAIDPIHLSEVDAIIEEAVARISSLFNKIDKKTEVYHLGIQFFNFAKKGSSK